MAELRDFQVPLSVLVRNSLYLELFYIYHMHWGGKQPARREEEERSSSWVSKENCAFVVVNNEEVLRFSSWFYTSGAGDCILQYYPLFFAACSATKLSRKIISAGTPAFVKMQSTGREEEKGKSFLFGGEKRGKSFVPSFWGYSVCWLKLFITIF